MTASAPLKHDQLSDTQLILLSRASQREDRLIMLPAHLRGGAARSVLLQLLGRQLIEERPACDDNLRSDRPAYGITQAGLRLLGVDEAPGDDAPCRRVDAVRRIDAKGGSGREAQSFAAAARVTRAMNGPSDHQGIASGGGAGPQGVGAQASAPRLGSKLAAVVGLLRQPEGASLAELEQATGWLPHTGRAALTDLRKRGYAVRRERGEEGSSRYRIGPVDPAQTLDGSTATSDGPHEPSRFSTPGCGHPAGPGGAASTPKSPDA
jgi:hypothetical protein